MFKRLARALAMSICLASFAVAQLSTASCEQVQGVVHELSFETPLYRKAVDVFVYTPPCYESSIERYPVLYLLHGGGGSPKFWLQTPNMPELADELIYKGEIQPLILVMPKQIDYGVLFAEHLETDIYPSISKQFRTREGKAFQGVVGVSAGGGTVIHLTLGQENRLFGSAAIVAGVRTVNQELIERNLQEIAKSDSAPHFFLDVGDADGLRAYHETLQSLFNEAGVAHDYFTGKGGHDLAYFLPRFPEHLKWFDAQWPD